MVKVVGNFFLGRKVKGEDYVWVSRVFRRFEGLLFVFLVVELVEEFGGYLILYLVVVFVLVLVLNLELISFYIYG